MKKGARYCQLKLKIVASDYVFPGSGNGGYLVEPRVQMGKITEFSGVNFTVHDLRRTFITIAESLDIAAYSLKRLLNHKMTNDVTSGYIITDVERLRKPMQLMMKQPNSYTHKKLICSKI